MICFVTDVQNDRERDILESLRHGILTVCDLDGVRIATIAAPAGGWTHGALVLIAQKLRGKTHAGADAFINGHWVGSTEV